MTIKLSQLVVLGYSREGDAARSTTAEFTDSSRFSGGSIRAVVLSAVFRAKDFSIGRRSGGKTERFAFVEQVSGGHTAGVTPVPIPNTEVKLRRADDTARVTVWERRSPPD